MAALFHAVHERRWRQAELLIDMGCNVNGKGKKGRTPLIEMCFIDNEKKAAALARVLLEKGADISVQDNNGRTALSNACLLRRKKLFGLFMESVDFDLNSSDHDGNTALFHAITAGDLSVVKALITKILYFGLKIDVFNAKGETPLLYALKTKKLDIAYVLIEQGKASLEARDLEFQKSASQWKDELTKATENKYILPERFLQPIQDNNTTREQKKTGSAKHYLEEQNHLPPIYKPRPVTAPDRIVVPDFLRPCAPIKTNLYKLYVLYNQQTTDSYRYGYKPIRYKVPPRRQARIADPKNSDSHRANKSGVSFNQVNELSVKLQGLYKNSAKRKGLDSVENSTRPNSRSSGSRGSKILKGLSKTVQQFELNKKPDRDLSNSDGC